MQEIASGKLVVQRSKFFTHLYELAKDDGEEEIKAVLKEHKRIYKKANHHCWALRSNGEEKGKDDGEVGHPGKVMLEVLRKGGFNSHIMVTSRVFGGVKLGVGGVSRAFRDTAQQVADTIL